MISGRPAGLLQRANGVANGRRRILFPAAGISGCVRRQYAPRPEVALTRQQVVPAQPMETDVSPSTPESSLQPNNSAVQEDIAALLEYRPPPVQNPQAGIYKKKINIQR